MATPLALGMPGCGGSARSTGPAPGTAGDFTKTVVVAGVTRTYLLHVPGAYRKTAPSPVVLLLHGGGGSAAQVGPTTAATGFSGLADRKGFIAAYPDAVSGFWDDGRAVNTHTNDIAFMVALLDALALEYNVDSKRVYATGISNGGLMSYRLACELSNRIAAVAPVAANISADLAAVCRPGRAVPVAMFAGTADPLMPYGGGMINSALGGVVLSAPESAAFWVQNNQVVAIPQISALPDTDPTDGMTTDQFNYGGAASAGEVSLYRVNGGGHTWPGGTPSLPVFLVGRVTKDFSANEVMWDFFSRHPRP